jgi:hypothetical protein
MGGGVPLLPEGPRASHVLKNAKPLPSGILMLSYTVKEKAKSAS